MTQLFEANNIEWNNIDSSFCKKLPSLSLRENLSPTKLLYLCV